MANESTERRYLSTRELCRELPGTSRETVRKRIADGTWKEGLHFFRPVGHGKGATIFWSWPAIVAWIEGSSAPTIPADNGDGFRVEFTRRRA